MDMTNRNPKPQERIAPSMAFILIFGALVLAGGFLVGIVFTPLVLPEQASLQAQNTDSLFRILLILGGVVFFLVQGLLLVSVIRWRARPGDLTDGPPVHGNMTLEIVWTVIPAVVVIVLSVLAFVVWNTNRTPQPNENFVNGQPIDINVTGARFAWTFEYVTNVEKPLAEGETLAEGQAAPQVVFRTSELHTFLGQNVKLDMVANDVIHSFWVPAMRVKQDLLPGRVTEIRFTPIRVEGETYPARYRIVCAELCGGGHGQMYGWLVVHETEQAYLESFYDQQVFAALNPPADPVARGQIVLASGAYPCSNCHVLNSLDWGGITGPSLNGIGGRAGRRVGGLTGAEYLVQSLHLPNEYIVPGYSAGVMPYFGLTREAPAGQNPYNFMPEEDVIAIVAYLCTQTDSGSLDESTCGLVLDDPEAATEALKAISETYYALYGISQ